MLTSACLVLQTVGMCQKVILLSFFSTVDGIVRNEQKALSQELWQTLIKNNCEYIKVTKPFFIASSLALSTTSGFGAEMDSSFMYQLSFTLYKAAVSRWFDRRLTITYQKSFTEKKVKVLVSVSRKHYLELSIFIYFILCRNRGNCFYAFPVEYDEILFASWLSNNWKSSSSSSVIQAFRMFLSMRKHRCFNRLLGMYFGFTPMYFLSSGALTSIIVCNRKAASETWDTMNAVWTEGIDLMAVPGVLSLYSILSLLDWERWEKQ